QQRILAHDPVNTFGIDRRHTIKFCLSAKQRPYRAFPKRSPHHSNPTRHSIFDHEERQIISVNVSVVTNNNSVLHFFGLRPAHVAIRCHFPDSFLLYGVV
ncbi:hypothetical protein, partial [Escherichia coli]|uniref:hypothetical protein n=2 Tax=Escherichia coli TaxID=562 RepID=UPI0032D955D9